MENFTLLIALILLMMRRSSGVLWGYGIAYVTHLPKASVYNSHTPLISSGKYSAIAYSTPYTAFNTAPVAVRPRYRLHSSPNYLPLSLKYTTPTVTYYTDFSAQSAGFAAPYNRLTAYASIPTARYAFNPAGGAYTVAPIVYC